jgi:2-iminobutanoate/2-iminopropanoate deaminase
MEENMKKVISTSQAPRAIGPYSQAVQAGPFLFCSGQIALNADATQPIPEGVVAQTHQIFKNIQAILTEAGYSLNDVVKTTIFLTDMSDFQMVNEVYGSYFTNQPPARSTVAVRGLPRGVLVEIEVLAYKG